MVKAAMPQIKVTKTHDKRMRNIVSALASAGRMGDQATNASAACDRLAQECVPTVRTERGRPVKKNNYYLFAGRRMAVRVGGSTCRALPGYVARS